MNRYLECDHGHSDLRRFVPSENVYAEINETNQRRKTRMQS